jgi:hypothetical protein
VGFPEPTIAERREQLNRCLDDLVANPTSQVVGDLLYGLVGWADDLGVDAEEALRVRALAARDRIVDVERSSAAESAGPG